MIESVEGQGNNVPCFMQLDETALADFMDGVAILCSSDLGGIMLHRVLDKMGLTYLVIQSACGVASVVAPM